MKFNKKILIDNIEISKKKLVIIAEAGVNHFGSFEKMKKLIDLAKEAKADIFKTQFFFTDELISHFNKEWYQRMIPKEVDINFIKKSKIYAEKKGLVFMCTPHDEKALEKMDPLNLSAYKIGSGEKGNFNFLEKVITKNKPLIISTGMHTLKDVEKLVFFLKKNKVQNVVLLHCITSYPTPLDQLDLLNIENISKQFNILTGYSDHTNSFLPSYLAVSRGACIVEKHITLDFNVENSQDWKVSAGPQNFGEFVDKLRSVKMILGNKKKIVQMCEKPSLKWAIKRVVASRDLKKGELVSLGDIKFKRIDKGIDVENYKALLGKKLKNHIKKNAPILKRNLEK